MNEVFFLDTRNQKDYFVEKSLKKLGYKVLRSKLPFGDVALNTNILRCIDLKSSGGGLLELAKNRCSKDRNRMKEEINKCFDYDGEIIFMCFEPNINCIEDIANWEVPLFSKYYKNKELRGKPMTQVKPVTLMKSIQTMCEPNHYKEGKKVEIVFVTKENCGAKIVELLMHK